MQKEIRVPVWLITLICVIGMALIGFLWKQAITQGEIVEQVRQLRTDHDTHVILTRSQINHINNTTITRHEFDRMQVQLNRIEDILIKINGR